jgi:predicted deacylase
MKIFDKEVALGEYAIIRIPAPKLYNLTQFFLPVHVIRGHKPGPILCITAALHGDEVNGIEIVRQLLKQSFVHALEGTLIIVPLTNIYGVLFQDRYLPDRRDLNRSFPGSEKGSFASRLAHLLTKVIFAHATHFIDLHTGSLKRTNLPQIRVDLEVPEVIDLAHAFGAPVILPAPHRPGSFREYARLQGIPYLLYEAGEASRFNQICIRTGTEGILRVMRHLHMLPASKSSKKQVRSIVASASYWVRSPFGGIFIAIKQLGNHVEKGDVLGVVVYPTELEEHEIISPIAGIIIGSSDSPLIHEGAGVFHIACFENAHSVIHSTPWLQNLKDMDKEEDGVLEAQLDG